VVHLFPLDLSDWAMRAESELASHRLASQVVDLLVAAIDSESKNQPDVLDNWRRNVRFILARDCVDVLVSLVVGAANRCNVVERLPKDWQRLYASHKLLDRGIRDDSLIELAISECNEHARSSTAQASADRIACLIALQRVVPDRVPAIQNERHGLSWFFGGGLDAGSRLAAQIDGDVAESPATLEREVAKPSDLLLVSAWHEEAQTWPAILMSEAYSRMFKFAPCSRKDVLQLLERQVAGVTATKSTVATHEHLTVYESILEIMQGSDDRLITVRSDRTPIVQSHSLAAEIIALARKGVTRDDIRRQFVDRRGWFEDHNHKWEEGGRIGHGFGQSYGLVVFYPAVRLALWALGARCGWNDPGFSWMQERRRAILLIKEHIIPSRPQGDRRKRAIRELSALSAQLPDQEILSAELGQLLLEDGQLEEARTMLNIALESPLCTGEDRGGVLYNLACYYSRTHDEGACRQSLECSAKFKPLDPDWIARDTALDAVRTCDWFSVLLGSARPA
jgi:hypothetical protein